ncbi:MAG TPA: hypothetical protein VG406_24285 [Isosphaeraceae bacterium]|nr:hypothetical protein [Isosphaeraceae bacterium]
MENTVQHVLDSFDRLTETDRRRAASEILRRTLDFETPPRLTRH